MLTGFRMTSVMRTSTLSSVTKHVGANTTIKGLILVRSRVLASQSGEDFDKGYAEPLWSLPARGAAPRRSPMALCIRELKQAEAGRQN
jgi:hypothetical protein